MYLVVVVLTSRWFKVNSYVIGKLDLSMFHAKVTNLRIE